MASQASPLPSAEARRDRGNVQRLADHTGGRNGHALRRNAQAMRDKGTHLPGDFDAICIAGVGIAAVADHRLGGAVGDMCLRHRQRRTLDKIGGIDRRSLRRHSAHDQSQILFRAAFADAAVNAGGPKALGGTHAAGNDFHHADLSSKHQACRFLQTEQDIHVLDGSAGGSLAKVVKPRDE